MKRDDLHYQTEYKKLQTMNSEIQRFDRVYFYGAGLRSEEIIQMQKEGYPIFKRPELFIVTSMQYGNLENAMCIDGIPVVCVHDISEIAEDTAIVVIAMDIYHAEISERLQKYKCKNVYYLTNDMEHLITREFLKYYNKKNEIYMEFLPFDKNYRLENKNDNIHTYSVMCERDAEVKNIFEDVWWISNLQAGAAKANIIIAPFKDDNGDNISELNSYYNELTGLYWVWKNTDYEYTGICHYRRRFESEIALQPIVDNTADVVLPLPFVIGENLATYYLHCGEASYYQEMLNVISDVYPEYKNTASWCAEHVIFIPNNICITNRTILNKYCTFLFDVVDEVERRMKQREGKKQTRCWLSEHVSTIFFMHHLNDYKIVFANLERRW